MKRLGLVVAIMLVASVAQAQPITSFDNLDFDSGGVTTPGPFKGFDAPDAPEIAGWTNYPAGALNDAGVEGPGAWWGPYDVNAGFMSGGDAAYTMSTYTIQPGDIYQIGFVAKQWNWTGAVGEWTATLFYDDPANVIGSFVQTDLPDGWTAFSSAGIPATPASVGGTLGILMTSSGSRISQVDEITVSVVPEPATICLVGFCVAGLMFFRREVR